ncbi:MAG: hypothetical protein QXL01_02860 [Thermoplasmatales archaeon]
MKITSFFSFLLMIIGCASCGFWEQGCDCRTNLYETVQVGPHTRARDPKITPYIQEFINDFKDLVPTEMLDLSVLYSYRYETIVGEEGKDVVGMCSSWTFGEREIILAPYLYETDYLQKSVIYHELGHCLFDLGHDPDGSLMSEYIFDQEEYWKDNWAEELKKFKSFVVSEIRKRNR